jgi:hypothetical protein
MKLKGINPFERHVEKIILAGGALAVLGVAAWQVLNAPAVTFGGRQVAPGQVDSLLEERARALQSQLRGESTIKIPEEGVALAAPTFDSALAKEVAPRSSLPVASPALASALIHTTENSTDVWYHEPAFAGIQMVDVIQTADALTPESAKRALAIAPALAARFASSEGPQDVVWTTPVARLDLKGIRAELARAEPGAKPPRAALPGVWYQDTPFVVDVVFQRREVLPGGGYGPVQTVPVFSPREAELDFRSRIAGAKAELRDTVFGMLRNPADQAQILQLPFFETVNGSFVSPTVRVDAAASGATAAEDVDRRRLMQMKTQLETKRRAAQKLSDELKKLGGPWDEAKEKEDEERRRQEERERKEAEKGTKQGSGGGGGGFGMGGGGMDGRNKGAGGAEDAAAREREKRRVEEQRKSKTRLLKRFETEIADLEKQLGSTPAASGPDVTAKLPDVAHDEEVLIWGHDLEVEPGHTYQYRAVAHLYNPFFARGNQLVKAQDEKELDQAFTIATADGPWSKPVVVSPRVRFFVTQANAGAGQLGMGTAQVEVYRLVDGQWRRSEMQVQPGERIGRVDDRSKAGGKSVDFTTDFYVAAIVDDLEQKPTGDRTRRPAMVVVRPLQGGPEELRSPESDLSNDTRVELRAQASVTAEPKAPAGAPAGGSPPVPPAGGGPGGGPGGGGGLGR